LFRGGFIGREGADHLPFEHKRLRQLFPQPTDLQLIGLFIEPCPIPQAQPPGGGSQLQA
jgi:hypothetical protein